MGNCQAIDNATLVIQHPKGRVEKHLTPVSASQIMKMNPGHYVALLLTTTLYSSASASTASADKNCSVVNNKNKSPVRVTRIKLLRPDETLSLGHVYRLVTTQEVKKGLWAKKQARMKQQQQSGYDEKCKMTDKEISYYEALLKKTEEENSKQVKHERQRSRHNSGAALKARAWQPVLQSISEAAT